MNEQPQREEATINLPVVPEARAIRSRFESAWDDALKGGSRPPDLERFLLGTGEAERLALRQELQHVARSYEQRLSQTALPAQRGAPPPTDATLSHEVAPAPAGDTHNAVALDETVDGPAPRQEDSFGTAAFLPPDPAGTLEHPQNGVTDAESKRGTASPDKGKYPQIAGYDILGVLGRGAMGVVYQARQRGLKRLVALKMILAGDHASERDLARFRIEAEAVAHFQHPNIVQIYEVGEHDGKPYFSLEYVDGDSLAKKIDGTPLPPRAAAETIRVMAQAMHYAHQKGIIHRDLKPANVLLTKDGQPKITDFGLAKNVDEDSGQTATGSVLGTPSYMPPEQAEGRIAEVGPLSDVYSLGAILYELLTGRAPFRAATLLDTLSQVRKQEPVSPVQLQPGTPRDLETICLKCLQKDAKKRYADAAALAEDLRRYLAGEPIEARPVPAWEHAWRWCRRNPVVASLSGAVALLVVGSLIGLTIGLVAINSEKNAKEQETIRANDTAARNKKLADEAINKQNIAVSQVINMGAQTQKALRRKSANNQLEAELQPLREQLLQTIRAHMLELAKEMELTGVTSSSIIFSRQALGDLFRSLGMGAEALAQYQEAHKLAKQLVEEQPEDDRHRANMGVMLARFGDMALALKADLPAARDYYRQSLDLQKDVESHPRNLFYTVVDNKRLKSFYLLNLGQVGLRQGNPAAARQDLDASVAYRRDWVKQDANSVKAKGYLAEACLALGDACSRLGDDKALRAAFDEAVGIIEPLVQQFPDSFSFKADLAEVYLTYGEAHFRRGAYDEARANYAKCIPLLTAAINNDPEEIRYLDLVVRTKYQQGLAARQARDPKAADHFASALKFCDKLVAIDKVNLPYQVALAQCLARTGKTGDAVARADDLRPRVAKDPELLVRLAGCYAVSAAATVDAAEKQAATAKALDALKSAVTDDYKDRDNLLANPDLEALHDDASFKALVGPVKGK